MKAVDMTEHPEGGRFREVFRSPQIISAQNGSPRSALTHIYFSLNPGEVSRFHRLTSDEIWNLYQGAGLNLYLWDGSDRLPECITLSVLDNCFCYAVPAGVWQAAEPISDTVLVGCSVAPGFELSDFTLLDPRADEAKRLIDIAPAMDKFMA